jgi:hypothetical protein
MLNLETTNEKEIKRTTKGGDAIRKSIEGVAEREEEVK